MKRSIDLLKQASKEGYEFTIHNQGTEESCVSHAFTAAHEILRHKALVTQDLLEGSLWMTEIGALMMDIAKKIETTGQKEKASEAEQGGGRPKRFCRSAFKLSFNQLPINITKIKARLSIGKPVVTTVTSFTLKPRGLITAATRSTDKHSMGDDVLHAVCIYGFVDDVNDEGGGRFLCVNSHGEDWGDDGKGSISYQYLKEYAVQVWGAADLL